jgi:hypothetical protein
MAVHVAKAADVHQDIEPELLSRAERAQQFVVLAPVAQSKIDDFAAASVARGFDRLPKLAVRIMAVLVEQGGRQFDFKRVRVKQIDRRRRFKRSGLHQIGGRLPEFAARLDLIRIRVRVLNQRGRDSHLVQEFLFGALSK